MFSLPHQIVLTAGYCAYLDVENAMDPSLAELMGINTKNKNIFCVQSSAEQLPILINTLTRTATVYVVVVDIVSDYSHT